MLSVLFTREELDRLTGKEEIAEAVVTEEPLGRLSDEEADALMASMEAHAEVAPDIDLNIENWDNIFGENGTVETPIGTVKMGEHQFPDYLCQRL